MATKHQPGPHDCYAKARDDEPMFVLLGRDPSAGRLVRVWADMRAATQPADAEQIAEAREVSQQMDRYAIALGKKPIEQPNVATVAYIRQLIEKAAKACDAIGEGREAFALQRFAREYLA